jgi:hypothetical protein
MGLKDRYNAATTAPAEPTPERDLAALRAKLASGQTGGVNPPEAKDRMTDDIVAPQPSSTGSAPTAPIAAPSAPAPDAASAEPTSAKRGRKPAAVPAEPLSTEQIVEMHVSRGYAVNLERR